jgi:DNA-binding LacI/PurR family transcriptional regulator
MGVLAAETVLQRINATVKQPYPKEIIVEPGFIVRGSTGPAPRLGPEK